MSADRPDWNVLNAYVDGELPPQEAAAVARASETDREVADQIALLYQLKGAVRASVPAAPQGLAQSLRAPERRFRWRAVLALVAAVAVAGLVAPVLIHRMAGPAASQAQGQSFLASARAMHARWLALDHRGPEAAVPMPAVLDTLTRFGKLPVVPDLQSTGLEINLVTVSDPANDRILQIGYRGHHGCHLSMFVEADAALPDPAEGTPGPNERARSWQVGDLTYLLLADGMDRGRFDLIAMKIEGASRRFAPLDSADRQQLAENHRQARSCAA